MVSERGHTVVKTGDSSPRPIKEVGSRHATCTGRELAHAWGTYALHAYALDLVWHLLWLA